MPTEPEEMGRARSPRGKGNIFFHGAMPHSVLLTKNMNTRTGSSRT